MKALLFVDHNSNAFHLKSPPSLALRLLLIRLRGFLCKSENGEENGIESVCLRNGNGSERNGKVFSLMDCVGRAKSQERLLGKGDRFEA